MAEEKRRKLDPITDTVETDPVKKITKENWRKTYMFDADVHDLENMARHFSGYSKTVRTTVTQRIQPKDRNIPTFVRQNPDHAYGVKSDLATRKAPTISKIVNNDYLKEFLTDRIATKAIEATNRKGGGKRGRNKAFKFRSGSVMARVPPSVKEAERAILQKAAMRSSVQTPAQSDKITGLGSSQRSHPRAASVLDTIQPTASNALELGPGDAQPVTSGRMHKLRDNKALNFMHKLRTDTFEKRCEENKWSVKPYLPMLISDKREVIDEQFEASKK